MTIERLSLNVHTLYQQLFEQTIDDEQSRNIGSLRGSFVTKSVKGHQYWYLQYHEAGKQKQVYLGADSQGLRDAIKRWKTQQPAAERAAAERRRLCAMLRQGGASALDAPSAKVLGLLADSGVFRLGAVLIGTHAFRAYANMLGVVWEHAAVRTQGLDLAQAPCVALAVSAGVSADLPSALERAEMGFIPIPALDPRHPSTSFKVAGREIKLDVLTPLVGRPRSKPIELPALKTHAKPLRFLDYLIEDYVPTVLVNADGILANIPQPARFAWHKLLVADRRPVTEQAKQQKDLVQVCELLNVLLADRPGELTLAWRALVRQGTGLIQAVNRSLRKIDNTAFVTQIKDFIEI